MYLAPHVSDQHVSTFHGQTSALVATDVISTVVMNGHSQETEVDCGNVTVHWDNIVLCAFKLPGLPFNQQYCRRCALLDFKDVCCAMTFVALIIAIAVPACDMHTCTISFDLWAPRHLRSPKIHGFGFRRTVEKFADSDANSASLTTLTKMLLFQISFDKWSAHLLAINWKGLGVVLNGTS